MKTGTGLICMVAKGNGTIIPDHSPGLYRYELNRDLITKGTDVTFYSNYSFGISIFSTIIPSIGKNFLISFKKKFSNDK